MVRVWYREKEKRRKKERKIEQEHPCIYLNISLAFPAVALSVPSPVVDISDNIVLTCNVTGLPLPDVTWFFGSNRSVI